MKTNKIKGGLSLIAFSALTILASCTAGFEDANRPGGNLSREDLNKDNYATGSFMIQLQNEAFPEQENKYQMNVDLIGNYLGRYMTYAHNGFSNNNFVMMNAPTEWANKPFKDCTPMVVSAFKEIYRYTEGEGINYAWALILRAQAFLRLTDIYGPYPIGAESDPNAYSSQEKVYKELILDLDSATNILAPMVAADPNLTVSADYDHVYGGKFAKWLKFANSLKLRMAIRMRFADPAYARQVGEAAVAGGVITSNDDNLEITYVPNGQYKTSVEWGDSRACADIECYMNGYKDPRITKYFKATETAGDRAVIGCLAGAAIGNKVTAMSVYSAANIEQNSRGVWMTAAEITFCRAEGALAGWSGMGGSVEELYNQAIRLSFEQWGAGGVDAYLQDATSTPAAYVDAEGGFGKPMPAASTITIKWDESASNEVKLERLITQKWIAGFPNGDEGWAELRRTGYPKVFDVARNTTIKVANRVPFCTEEPINNKDNYEKAVQLLGGADNYTTKLWWQR